MKKKLTRLLSLLLVVVLFAGMMEASALAASYSTGTYEVSHAKGVNIRNTYSTSGTIKGTATKGTSFKVTKINGAWGYTSSIKATNGKTISGWVCLSYCKKLASSTSASKTTVAISSSAVSVELGSTKNITGTVKSTGSKLKTITAKITNSAGTKTIAGLSKTVSVNTYIYALKNSSLDTAMDLSKLPSAGTYKLKITAKTADGKSLTKTYTITVTNPTTVAISSSAISVKLGSTKNITGTVKSTGSKLKTITAKITNSAGTKTIAGLSKTVSVNTYSYTLKNSSLDTAMDLSKLPSAGTYKLKITAKTADGKSLTKTYTITVTKPTTVKPSTSSNFKNMKAYTHKGTKYYVIDDFSTKYCFDQYDYNRFYSYSSGKNVGCTATAASMVLCMAGERNEKGKLITPNIYPWSGTCGWDYMTPHYSHGKSGFLKQLTQELLEGNAIATYANHNHCVTIIGFKANADLNNLKASDLLIVDPAGGTIKTLNNAASGGYNYCTGCGCSHRFYTAD